MASTPYWGDLPSTKSANSQHPSTGASLAESDHRQSLDAPIQLQPKQHREQHRVSVQTTNTEAPTESTMSPFGSPTSSSFPTQGLAPRPPSFPYGANRYPQQHQTDRDVYDDTDGYHARPVADLDDSNLPPAAPDVPKGPPLSYRPPAGAAHAYAYPLPPSNSVNARKPDLTLATDPMDLDNAEQRYASPGTPHAKDRTGARPADNEDARGAPASTAGGSSRPRHTSVSADQSERRNKFEKVRSPLQKLELTLDSITKEEKRARVAAAEQALRERGSRAVSGPAQHQSKQKSHHSAHARTQGQQSQQNQQNQQNQNQQDQQGQQGQQVRHHERSATVTDAEPRPLLQPDASPIEESYSPIAAHDDSMPQSMSDASNSSPTSERERAARPRTSSNASRIPKRNLSFRERAEQNDYKPPHAADFSSGLPTPPRRTSSLQGRDPSGDAWYNKRAAAERRYQESMQSSANKSAPRDLPHPPRPSGIPTTPPRQRQPSVSGHGDANYGRLAPGFEDAREGRHAHTRSMEAATMSDTGSAAAAATTTPKRRVARFEDVEGHDGDSNQRFDSPHHHRISNILYHARDDYTPGQGTYIRPTYLNEWQKGTIGLLHGAMLDPAEETPVNETGKAWWEKNGKRRGSTNARSRKGEAFDGEYDETKGPTRFKPPLHLVCGPLLRYCGIRKERSSLNRVNRNGAGNNPPDMEFWRGSAMIVTRDTDSSYDIAPTLRLFAQPMELLPPPPSEVEGSLPAEYVDPLVGHPKVGRNGETLYLRPVEQLPEARDLSREESGNGLFEKTKSSAGNMADPEGSFSARLKKMDMDGEKVGKFKDVRAFRLHAERGVTFWRFNLEIELRETQQRIAYRINRGPATGFWVPAKGQSMHIMFHSCNGFSLNVNRNQFSGPDPMWRDVLNTHQTEPFHVMIGGGDQIYNDMVMHKARHFQDWLGIKNPLQKHNAPFTAEMQDELENFYLNRYAMWFSQGLFSLANSQIPMVNMYDDHDIIDGFGSYPHHFMNSPVFSGLGNVAFKYYILFQHQSVIGETEQSEPSWILGKNPGPYIEELSHSLFMSLGGKVAFLAVDCRTERMRDEVVHEETWKRIMDRCYAEIEKGTTEHLIVLLGVPIAYPRLVWLENILTSRLMDPIKALGKTGMLGGFLNRFDGGVEVLDDLDDHWTAKDHKDERKVLIEDLQDLAADKSVRVTILSGDVHLAAVGEFYSNPKLGLAKHRDFRYMPNVISSAIANAPPSDLLADVLNKRNKVHHFDSETDEDMIPIFTHDVDGKPRNNKRLLPHRNWCSIQPYMPGTTPEGTPSQSMVGLTARSSIRSVLRRKSTHRDHPYNAGVSRPPVSTGFLRTLSRGHASVDNVRRDQGGGSVKRSFSLSGGLFRRLSTRSQRQPNDGGINGSWGANSDEVDSLQHLPVVPPNDPMPTRGTNGTSIRQGQAPGRGGSMSTSSGEDMPRRNSNVGGPRIRGGAAPTAAARGGQMGYNEFEAGDDNYFSVKRRPAAPAAAPAAVAVAPAAANTSAAAQGAVNDDVVATRRFYRTPTGLTARQAKRAKDFEVNLEGGLDIRLNVEVNPKDPTGITAPYRLVVPRLWYTYEGEDSTPNKAEHAGPTGLKRLLSLGRKRPSMDVPVAAPAVEAQSY